ncbi:MAG: hypothetical protein WDZ41_02080 [Candidatus Babeliales bacterium]
MAFYTQIFDREFRGVLLIVFGVILLLHTLNILEQWLNWFLIFFSIALIIFGVLEARIWQKTLIFIRRIRPPQSEE